MDDAAFLDRVADSLALLEATDDARRMLTAAVTREGVLPAD